jgi:hypothetical protein
MHNSIALEFRDIITKPRNSSTTSQSWLSAGYCTLPTFRGYLRRNGNSFFTPGTNSPNVHPPGPDAMYLLCSMLIRMRNCVR